MQTPKRHEPAGLIQQLLDRPHQFEFFQAVQLLERLLAEQDFPGEAVSSDFLRFRNSTSQQFPASQIESLEAATGEQTLLTEAKLIAALRKGELTHVSITPTFFGLLGTHGVLPDHYGERITAHQQIEKNGGATAFMDMFSHRMVALFYLAWRKHRPELSHASGKNRALRPSLLSTAGIGVRPVPDRVATYYAAAFAHRPVSPCVIENVLNDYFNLPIHVVPNAGRWHALEQRVQTGLGTQNCTLSAGAVLGSSMWRRDLLVLIKIGPLSKRQYNDFLKNGDGANALRNMLSMFETPTLRYEVQLTLRAADVEGVTLPASAPGGARLGIDAFLVTATTEDDRSDTSYTI